MIKNFANDIEQLNHLSEVLSNFFIISGNDCKCVHYEDCRWSSEVMKLISQMPRKDPRRIEKINFVRNQTCDTKQKLIYYNI